MFRLGYARYMCHYARSVAKSGSCFPAGFLSSGLNVNESRSHMTSYRSSAVKLPKTLCRFYTGAAEESKQLWTSVTKDVVECSDDTVLKEVSDDFLVFKDFISKDEENRLYEEVQPQLRKLRYEKDHWDNVG